MQAMIFAAGLGTRLKPLTLTTPKPLVPVQGKPMLDWVLQHLLQHGLKRVVVNLHHLAEQIEAHLTPPPAGLDLRLSHEPQILGTGGGLYQAREHFDQDFLVCNADILSNFDLAPFLAFHQQRGGLASLAVNQRHSDSMFLVDQAQRLVGRRVKGQDRMLRPAQGQTKAVGFAAFHLLSPDIFGWIKPPVAFSIIEIYEQLVQAGAEILCWPLPEESYWIDIGTPQALEEANREFPGHQGRQAGVGSFG